MCLLIKGDKPRSGDKQSEFGKPSKPNLDAVNSQSTSYIRHIMHMPLSR